MAGPFTTPVAVSVPLENRDVRDNDFKSLNVQDGLEEIDFRREQKEPTGFLDKGQSNVSFDDLTRTFTISPIGASYKFFIAGEEFVITGPMSVVLNDTEGLWYIHFTKSSLVATQIEWEFGTEKAFIANIYWDSFNKKQIYFAEHRHGLVMDWATHKRFHLVEGAQSSPESFKAYNYITREDGSLNSHAEIAFEEGTFYNEDIQTDIIDSISPVLDFEQTLSLKAKIPIFYKVGPENNYSWRKLDAIDAPVAIDGANTPFFNFNNSGVWELKNITEEYFTSNIICISGNYSEPMFMILAQDERQGAADSVSTINVVNDLKGLPVQDIKSVEFLVYQSSTFYTNVYHTRLIEVVTAGKIDIIKDRYTVSCFYGGNANSGRVLEFGSGDDSESQPLLFPEDSYIRTVTLQATANIPLGKKIGFFKLPDIINPIFEVIVTIAGSNGHRFDVSEFFPENSELAIIVTQGNIQKPVVRFWIETINI